MTKMRKKDREEANHTDTSTHAYVYAHAHTTKVRKEKKPELEPECARRILSIFERLPRDVLCIIVYILFQC